MSQSAIQSTRTRCCECGQVHNMNESCAPTLLEAFLAGYDVGHEDGRDDSYSSKPIRKLAFEAWRRERAECR